MKIYRKYFKDKLFLKIIFLFSMITIVTIIIFSYLMFRSMSDAAVERQLGIQRSAVQNRNNFVQHTLYEVIRNISKIQYEGAGSDNPLAFKHYNENEVVLGKSMKEHLRFAVAYWHTLTMNGSDPFGQANMIRPWETVSGLDLAKARVEVNFEFIEKLGAPYFCFHDVDVAPEGATLKESNENLDVIVAKLKEGMNSTGVKLLWNTANMFSNPRYVHGAATTNNADVFAYAAAQVKKGLETALELGAENYVFWGGREGYESLLNTDMGFELDNLARFFQMAVDYAKEIRNNFVQHTLYEVIRSEHDPSTASLLDQARLSRITSYNVCYTKLLRDDERQYSYASPKMIYHRASLLNQIVPQYES